MEPNRSNAFSPTMPAGRLEQTNPKRQAVLTKDRELRVLMQQAQAGNEAAYSELLQQLLPIVGRMSRRKLPNAAASDHDDILQEVLLSFHAARSTFDPNLPFLPWLKAIVLSRTVDFARKQSRNTVGPLLSNDLPPDLVDEAADRTVHRNDTVDAIRRAIGDLPTSQRSAIELLKLRELSLVEASAITGLSVAALKGLVHRAVGRLRITLAPYRVA
jgi:RNA polymerase sigma factor (sigma-70 family)